MSSLSQSVVFEREVKGRSYRSEGIESDTYGLQLDPYTRISQSWSAALHTDTMRVGGVQFLTYVFENSDCGLIVRADRMGERFVPPGGLSLTNSNRIVHMEQTPALPASDMHVLRFAVKLPEQDEEGSAKVEHLVVEEVVFATSRTHEIRVLCGQFDGAISTVAIDSCQVIAVKMLIEGEFSMTVPPWTTSFVMPAGGDIVVEQISFGRHSLLAPVLKRIGSAGKLRVWAGAGSRFLVFTGKPLRMVYHRDDWVAVYHRASMTAAS